MRSPRCILAISLRWMTCWRAPVIRSLLSSGHTLFDSSASMDTFCLHRAHAFCSLSHAERRSATSSHVICRAQKQNFGQATIRDQRSGCDSREETTVACRRAVIATLAAMPCLHFNKQAHAELGNQMQAVSKDEVPRG